MNGRARVNCDHPLPSADLERTKYGRPGTELGNGTISTLTPMALTTHPLRDERWARKLADTGAF
jgi:hypothetical protein